MASASAIHAARRPGGSRSGLTILLVLGVMVVIAIVAIGILALLAADRQALRREEARMQAQWLATAGVERALARLLADEAYRNETWNTAEEDSGSKSTGTVTIRVEPQNQARRFVISAEAKVRGRAGPLVRAVRTTPIDLSSTRQTLGERP